MGVGGYVSVLKTVPVLLLILLWARLLTWVDKDAPAAHLPRTAINTAFLAGISLAQVSEFSFILMALAHGRGLVDHVGAMWLRIARRFEDAPLIVGYDLFNEPWPGTGWQACANPAGCPPGGFDQTALTAFFNRTVAAVRL